MRILKILFNHFLFLLYRYLKEKINELMQEKNHAVSNATKYKVSSFSFHLRFTHHSFQELLQTHRSAYNRLGKVQSSGNVLTHKQGMHRKASVPVKTFRFSSTKPSETKL